MQSWQTIQWAASTSYLLFVFAFGAVCGSFINVVVYRVPRGLNIVSPPSACPQCHTRLTWRENFPILGWLCLYGRCRFCRSRISPEYPIVEASVAFLFAFLFALWFMQPSILTPLGVDVDSWKPEWAASGIARAWPMFFAVLALIGSFVAATLVDAKTFTIPLAIPWFATAVGFAVHPLYAALLPRHTNGPFFPPHEWTIALPNATLLGATFGGMAGIALGLVLLRLKLLPLSFADYEEWEKSQTQDVAQAPEPVGAADPATDVSLSLILRRVMLLTGPALTLMLLGFAIGLQTGKPMPPMIIGLALGLLIGLPLRHLAEPTGSDGESADPVWTFYPHARREMLKEVLFLAPCLILAGLGAWLASPAGPAHGAAGHAPLWLLALGGSMLGYLVGGGIVWGVRILGSLAFGKEAMGLGDVHLLAAAGAILGWIDPVLAFFTAPFLGIGWAILSLLSSSVFKRAGTALPYGPHLAAATLMVIVLKPLYEAGLALILHHPINIP